MKFLEKCTSLAIIFWYYLKILPRLLYSSWKVSGLPQPVVTFFGGKRLSRDCIYTKQAFELAKRLSESQISIVTGGGPGIMEAGNCGAAAAPDGFKRTIGIGVTGLNIEEPINKCAHSYLLTNSFYLRKHLLIYYSRAYVIFPGGFGTLDELFEVLTFMQTHKLPVMPIILIGKSFWEPIAQWTTGAEALGLIPKEHAQYITITDDIDKAFNILHSYCLSSACNKWQHRGMI